MPRGRGIGANTQMRAIFPTRRGWRPATRLVRGGTRSSIRRDLRGALPDPGFAYDSAEAGGRAVRRRAAGFIYQRFGNPTTQMFEDRLALMEGAEVCRATASGMAAVHGVADRPAEGRRPPGGGRARSSAPAAGSSPNRCRASASRRPRRRHRPRGLAARRAAQHQGVLLESPANPLLEVTAIGAVAEIAHAAGAKLVVDNVFATPIFQKPLALGADIVVYSATKHIDGQGRVPGRGDPRRTQTDDEPYKDILRHTGPALSPVQRLGAAEGPGDAGAAGAPPDRNAPAGWRDAIAGHPSVERVLYPAAPTIRRPRSPTR